MLKGRLTRRAVRDGTVPLFSVLCEMGRLVSLAKGHPEDRVWGGGSASSGASGLVSSPLFRTRGGSGRGGEVCTEQGREEPPQPPDIVSYLAILLQLLVTEPQFRP